MSKVFARLEDFDGGQVLATIQSNEDGEGEAGPTVTVRISDRHGVVPAVTYGPWPDDDGGWDAAMDALMNGDLQAQAAEIARMIDGMFAKSTTA